MHSENENNKVRLDKWLWAARFFKTRNLCKQAIEGGKVKYVLAEEKTQGVKANKMVSIGNVIEIRQGWDNKIIIVDKLSEKRGSASDAITLYHETEASKKKREQNRLLRQTAKEAVSFDKKKPDKRDRRRSLKFNRDNQE